MPSAIIAVLVALLALMAAHPSQQVVGAVVTATPTHSASLSHDDPSSSESKSPSPPFSATPTVSPSLQTSLTPSPSESASSTISQEFTSTTSRNVSVTAQSSSQSANTLSNMISFTGTESITYTRTMSMTISKSFSPTMGSISFQIITPTLTWRGMTETTTNSPSDPSITRVESASPSRTETGVMTLTPTKSETPSDESSASFSKSTSKTKSGSPTPSPSPSTTSTPTESQQGTWSSTTSPTRQVSSTPSASRSIGSGSPSDVDSRSASTTFSPSNSTSLSPTSSDDITRGTKSMSLSSTDEVSGSKTSSLDANTSTVARGSPSTSPTDVPSLSDSVTGSGNVSETRQSASPTVSKTVNSATNEPTLEKTSTPTDSHSDVSFSLEASGSRSITGSMSAWSATPNETLTVSLSGGTASPTEVRTPSPSVSSSALASLSNSQTASFSQSNTTTPTASETPTVMASSSETVSDEPDSRSQSTSYSASSSASMNVSSPSETSTPTPTATYNMALSVTAVPSPTRLSPTASQSLVATPTPVVLATETATHTISTSTSGTAATSPTASGSVSIGTLSAEPTATKSASHTGTPSATDEVTPSQTASVSHSPTVSVSSARSATDSLTRTAQSNSDEATPSASLSMTPTATPAITASPQPNATSTATISSVASVTESQTDARTNSRSTSASVSDGPRTLSPSPTVTLLPLETPSVSISPSRTVTSSMELTATPSKSLSKTATLSLTPSESVSSPRTNSLESLTGTPSPTATLSPSYTRHTQSDALSSTQTPSTSPTAGTATPAYTASESFSHDGGTPSPTQSTTLSLTLLKTITRGSSTSSESYSASEEQSSSPSSSRSRPTPSQSASLTPTSSVDGPSATHSSSDPRSMTVSVDVVRSSSGPLSATRSAPSPSGSTTLAGSMSFTNRSMLGSFSISHSLSDTPSPTEADTTSKSLSPPSASWEPSKSLSLLETETPTHISTPTPTLESSPTRASGSPSLSASYSTTAATSKSRSAGTPEMTASATASYIIASFTSTRTLIHTPSRSATDSNSLEGTASTSGTVSLSDERSSQTNTTSPTYTISASLSSSPSDEPTVSASVRPVDTETETLHATASASEARSATMSTTLNLTRTITLSEIASLTTTPSATEALTSSRTPSASVGPDTATKLPTVTRRLASQSKTARTSWSTTVRDSASVMPQKTASGILTITQQTSASKTDASPSTSPTSVHSATPSASPSPSPDPASSSRSASYTQTMSPLITATRILPITATPGLSRSHSVSDDGASASRSASEELTTSQSDTQTISYMLSATRGLERTASESSAVSSSSSVSDGPDSASRSLSRLRETLSQRASHSKSMTAGSLSAVGSASLTPSASQTPTNERSPSESHTSTNFGSVTDTIQETVTVGRLPTPTVNPSISDTMSSQFSASKSGHSPSSSLTSLTYSATFSQQVESKSTTFTGTTSETVVSTPTMLVSTTTTATLSLPISSTISRDSRSNMYSMTTSVSNSASQEAASTTLSDSSSGSEAMTYTVNSSSHSSSFSMTMTTTATVSLSSAATASLSLRPTDTLTITPPPTPSHSSSVQMSSTPSESISQSFTYLLSDTMRLSYTKSRSVTPTSSRSDSPAPSSTSSPDPSATASRSDSVESISSEESATTTFSRDISASTTLNESSTITVLDTPTDTLKRSDTVTHVPSLTDSGSETVTSVVTDTASLNLTESLTLSLTGEVSSTRTLHNSASPSISQSVSKDYISPNTTFVTVPYSASYEYTANRFLAIRLQGVPLNTTGDSMMLVKLYDSCTAPLNGNVTFRQSARPSMPLMPHNWTAVPRLSGVFTICYYTTTSGLWHKIVFPVPTIRIYAAASAQYILQVQNNTAVLSQYSLILYGANTSADKPFLVPFGRACSGPATTVAGNIFAFNNATYLTTIRFLNVPAAGDYSVCYLGYPHLLSKALLISGSRRMRIIGAVSSTVVGASMVDNFKVGRTVSVAISGVGLSVRDAFFLTNASLAATAPPPCSMPFNVLGAVRISWGQVDRVTTSDTVPSAFNLLTYSVSFRMSVPYNLSMCYRSNFSSTFALIGPLEYTVEPILPTWRAPNMSSSSLTSPSVWSLGGSLYQTFSGEGVSNAHDTAFLVINGTSCSSAAGALLVVAMGPLSSMGTTAFAILTLPSATALFGTSSTGGADIPATICYRSNFSVPLNMGQVLLTRTFWNASDPSTHFLFAVGMRMATNTSIAIASEAVTPDSAASNILYILQGVHAQCAAVAPLDATYANSRNRTHAVFYVANRGVYQLCAVSAATGAVQNASFASMPRDPTTITPTSTIGILQPTRIAIDGGVDFTATSTQPDVLYPCNASLASVVTVVPISSNSVLVTSQRLGVVSMCVRYGVQPSVTALAGNLTVVPQVHSIQTTPVDHRVGTTITIAATGFGLTLNDTLYPCDVSAAVLSIQLNNFSCASNTLDAAPCTSTWSAAAAGAGSFALCYRYARNVSFAAGVLTNLTTGANISVSFDAAVETIAPAQIVASITSFVNITGSGMAHGVSAMFLRTTSGSVCEATPVNPSDALYFTKVNASSSSSTAAGTAVDASTSWSLWTITNTASARGPLTVCYVSFSEATYTAGTLEVKSVVTDFSTTQQFVPTSSSLRYAGVEIDVVLVGAAMVASADVFFMTNASSSPATTCAAASTSAGARSVLYTSNQPSGLQTTLSYRVVVPTAGTYLLCYLRNGSAMDAFTFAGKQLVVSSSFFVTSTNITLVGPAPFLAPSFRFSFATNLTGIAPLTPYASASSASSISVLYMPVGTTLLSADIIGVNGLTILTINQTISFPVANTTICTNFPQSLLQSDVRYQFAMSFVALYNFDLTYCYDRIPANYVLSPSLLLSEVLALTASDVALIRDARTTMTLITRVSLKIPQSTSRTTALMATLLASTEQSLNIPDADITEELLLSHGDIVQEVFSAAAATTATFDRSTVLKAVNRLNLVGAKYCSSGIAGSSKAKEVVEDAYSFSTQNLALGTSQVTVRVTTTNAATLSKTSIETTAQLVNQNSLAGCFMSLAAPNNFIPGQSSTASSSRVFQAQDVASSVAGAFNVPLLSVSLPASTLSNPLAAFDKILFVIPHDGIPDSNLTLGVGIEYALYRFSPTFDGATTGEWVLDPAATATADNRTINITYDVSTSGATSTSNPQSYFFLSGRYRVFANTEPLVTRARDEPLILYVGALVMAHIVFVVIGMLADRRIDRRKENPHAPTATAMAPQLFSSHASSVVPPTAAYARRASAVIEFAANTDGEDVTPFGGHVESVEGTPTAADGDDAATTIASHMRRSSQSYRHAALSSRRASSFASPRARPAESSFIVQPDEMSPSHQPIDDGQSPTLRSIRTNTRWSLHRLATIFVRDPFHPVGVPARVTTLATFMFAVSIFSQVVLEEVVHEHAVAWNVLYGLCAAVMSTPFATPSRIGLLLLTKDVPSMAASVAGIVCVAAALFQSTVYVGTIACAVGGVVVVPLVWVVWYRRSSLETQPRLSRTPLVVGLVAHCIVEAAAIAYLLYRAIGEGTPTAWRRNQDYYMTVGFALAIDLCILEPLKNHLTLFSSVLAGIREMRYNERAMVKKANREARAREAADAKARQEELEAQARRQREEEEAQNVADLSEDEKPEPSEYRGHETDTEFERSEERALRKRQLPQSYVSHPRPPTQLDTHRTAFLEEEEDLDFAGKEFFEDADQEEDPFELPQRRQSSRHAPFNYDVDYDPIPPPLEEVDVAMSFAGSEFTSVLSDGQSSEDVAEPRDRAPAPANSRPSMRFDASSSDSDRPQRRSSRLSRISIVSALDDNWESFRSDDDEGIAEGGANVDDNSAPFDHEAFDGVPFDNGDDDAETDDGALSEIEVDYLDNSTR